MTIPEPIQSLIERLNQELDTTEQTAIQGLNLLQPFLSLFSNNAIIVRHFAYLNNALLLVTVSRPRVQAIRETLLFNDVTNEEIQEAGEELGEILGRTLETKIEAQRIIQIFEEQL